MIDFEKMQSQIMTQGEMIAEIYRILNTKGPSTDNEKPMSAKEASVFLGISMEKLYKTPEIPRRKKGRLLYFFRSELLEYLQG